MMKIFVWNLFFL